VGVYRLLVGAAAIRLPVGVAVIRLPVGVAAIRLPVGVTLKSHHTRYLNSWYRGSNKTHHWGDSHMLPPSACRFRTCRGYTRLCRSNCHCSCMCHLRFRMLNEYTCHSGKCHRYSSVVRYCTSGRREHNKCRFHHNRDSDSTRSGCSFDRAVHTFLAEVVVLGGGGGDVC
jgi:hypothetical protein